MLAEVCSFNLTLFKYNKKKPLDQYRHLHGSLLICGTEPADNSNMNPENRLGCTQLRVSNNKLKLNFRKDLERHRFEQGLNREYKD